MWRRPAYVNATSDLPGPVLTRVGDGLSDLINDVFADRGAHARAAVGVGTPAFGVPTIVEAVVGLGRNGGYGVSRSGR